LDLDEAVVERAVLLAETELRTPWDWADLALEVAGPVGENNSHNNRDGLLEELVSATRTRVADPDSVPAVRTLETRRLIASRVPPALRDGLSLTAAEPFAGAEPNEIKRTLELLVGERKTRDSVAEALRQVRKRPWSDEEQALRADLENGCTVVVNLGTHRDLIAWAEAEGLLVRIDRTTAWGNPFKLGEDGDRKTVIANYKKHYLPYKPSLQDRLIELEGKALACWCAPESCHGDVLADIVGDGE
jgi:hypothetical protein